MAAGNILPRLKRKRATTRGCPFLSIVMSLRNWAQFKQVLNQFRLREVLRERVAPPEDPDCLGGDCTRGLGERLNDGAGDR